MPHTPRVLSLASAAALTLALGQAAWAEQAPATPAAPAAAATAAPAAAPAPAVDTRRAEMDAQRAKHYADLRVRAKEVGIDLPETPPWETPMGQMPAPPAMGDYSGPSAAEWEAMRAEREALREKIRSMTPEERAALRESHWKKMRERAAERGVELPETPPWKAAEERYKAAKEQFERYRKIVDAMTDEQREAARAVFGGAPRSWGGWRGMPQGPYGDGPGNGYPGYGPMGYPPADDDAPPAN